MKICRLQLSNVYWHWWDPPWMNCYGEVLAEPGVDMLALQAEYIETLTMMDGTPFSPVSTMSPANYLRNQSFYDLLYYFDAIWGPSDDSLSDYRGNINDARWLEKLLAEALTANPDWRLPSYSSSQPDRYVTNAANMECQDFLISLMTGTHPQARSMANVPMIYLDDMNLYRLSQAEMEGWERVITEVQKTGQRVILNAGWNMKNYAQRDDPEWHRPEDDAHWYYPAAAWLEPGSAVMCEYDVYHKTGMSTTSGWWELTESRFEKMCGDMHDMGIDVYMVVRWDGDEDAQARDNRPVGFEERPPTDDEIERGATKASSVTTESYEEWMRPMLELCQSVGAIFCPSKHDYIQDPYEPWMADYQEEIPLEQWIQRECDERQAILLNPNAALQKVIYAEGGVPVENEFNLIRDGITYIVQKSEFTGRQEERYHYADVRDYNEVFSFTKSP